MSASSLLCYRLPRTHLPLLHNEDLLAVWEKAALALSDLVVEAKKVDPDPSEAQKESGNYKKGHVVWKGLPITIETAKGQFRRGVSKNGKPWSTEMHQHYGYIKGTKSEADADHIDVFLSENHLPSEIVFVINQVDPETGKFDEHKCVLGEIEEEIAKNVYNSNYDDNWKGFKSLVAMTLTQFKEWLEKGDTSREIIPADVRIAKSGAAPSESEAPFTIAVDFDGTIAEKLEPFDPGKIGALRPGAKKWLDDFRAAGARLIIFTVRGETDSVEKWLKENEIPYDHVNENPDQPPNSSGKIYADVYWDDRAYNSLDLDEHGNTILKMIPKPESSEEAAP